MGAFEGRHVPVMLGPAMDLLQCGRGGAYVDGTMGGGGYTRAVLEASAPDGRVLALDWDGEAVARGRRRLESFGARLMVKRASFARLPAVMEEVGWESVDGIVLDLGASSFQLDDPGRGFSFVRDGPLDMRMDRTASLTAADLVNTLAEDQLSRLISGFGEERWARRIARAIVAGRRKEGRRGYRRTRELSRVIERATPETGGRLRLHPATRTFQALRIAVNGELEALETFLDGALDLLKPGGRLCVVSFHSLEDRLVKDRFRQWARRCRCPAKIPRCQCEGRPLARLLVKKVLRPLEEEVRDNPRARSARLRALQKC